ncbi:hypothetical protein C8R46DRAFT_1041202 [Mycena filopes]|nr:hypothetical protein C8R46DRAFT_1041202 [Mycena filopes]
MTDQRRRRVKDDISKIRKKPAQEVAASAFADLVPRITPGDPGSEQVYRDREEAERHECVKDKGQLFRVTFSKNAILWPVQICAALLLTMTDQPRRRGKTTIRKIREKHAQEFGSSAYKLTQIEKMEAEIGKLPSVTVEKDIPLVNDAEIRRKRQTGLELTGSVVALHDLLHDKLFARWRRWTPLPRGYDEDPGLDVNDYPGLMGHVLRFLKAHGEKTMKAERDYEVIDAGQRWRGTGSRL